MTPPCTVLIAAADVLERSAERLGSASAGDLLPFADGDALRALEAIIDRRPHVVALERAFAATPRGVALMNRVKADPTLGSIEIRVVSHDTDYQRVARASNVRATPAAPGAPGATASAVAAAPAAVMATEAARAAAPAVAPLDYRGTRRAQRFRIQAERVILVDGNQANLVDLSRIGAQVVSGSSLKPNQRVRLSLADDSRILRFNGAVAWASFEIPAKIGPRYRAGIEFVDADSTAVDAFCARYKQA